MKIFALAAGKDGGIPLEQFETEYEELHHEKLDLVGFNSVEELLKNLYLNLVEVVDRLDTGIIRHNIRQPY